MDIGYAFAENNVKTNAKDLPPQVVEMTKKCILDILGCILVGGVLSADGQRVVNMFLEAGGTPEASVLYSGNKVPAWSAAFANGVLAHAIDFDDVVDETAVHPSLSTIPTALALAEKTGYVSGAEFITAIALGNDLICRLGAAIKRKQEGLVLGFRPAPVLGVFGAALAGSKILKLNQEAVVDTLGIVFHQGAAGTFEVILCGGDIKIRELYGGFIGMNGVIASLMAQRGITGIKTSFEGPAGLFNIYFQGKYDREYLVGDLGNRFDGMDACLKPWATNRMMHAHVQAAIELTEENNISYEDISDITVYVSPGRYKTDEAIKMPKNSTEARVHLPFCVGTAIANRGLSLKSFTDQGLTSDLSLKLAAKVKLVDSESCDAKAFFPPGKVMIKIKSGETFVKQVDLALGHPSNPLSFKDVADKFRDCAAFSRSQDEVENIIRMVEKLEDVADMRILAAAVQQGASSMPKM